MRVRGRGIHTPSHLPPPPRPSYPSPVQFHPRHGQLIYAGAGGPPMRPMRLAVFPWLLCDWPCIRHRGKQNGQWCWGAGLAARGHWLMAAGVSATRCPKVGGPGGEAGGDGSCRSRRLAMQGLINYVWVQKMHSRHHLNKVREQTHAETNTGAINCPHCLYH